MRHKSYGEKTASRTVTVVYEWYNTVKEGQTSARNNTKSGLPRVATTTIYKLKKLIEEDRRIHGIHFDN